VRWIITLMKPVPGRYGPTCATASFNDVILTFAGECQEDQFVEDSTLVLSDYS